ncbi:hypothetical protein ACFQJD_04665 [Haloplanus sp. GCM10025708]|uniref:hypothetical protein n=1 Tax=Haloplanus sp. GCM10025708 TaxID=3252679 RepID=UPI00360B39DA
MANGDVPQFQDNTSVEAFPDDDNDGIASYGDLVENNAGDDGFPGNDSSDIAPTACNILADVGADDSGLSSDTRTNGTVGGQTTEPGDPLIDIQDVKPGDFGEVTFSIHLCDNDGYVWMNAPGGLTTDEGGVTEPEADDEDEDQQEDGSPKEGVESPSVELADNIQTSIWYDNDCDNVPDGEAEPVDLMVIADTSNSLGDNPSDPEGDQLALLKAAADAFAEELPQGTLTSGNRAGEEIVRVGLMSFAGGENLNAINLLNPVAPVDDYLDNSDNGIASTLLPDQTAGDTPMPHALDIARKILNDPNLSGIRGSDVDKKILLVTDGAPNYGYVSGGTSYTVTYDSTPVTSASFTAGQYVEDDSNVGGDGTPNSGDPFEGSDAFPDNNNGDSSSDEERYETWQLAQAGSNPVNGDTTNDDDGMEILVAGIANEGSVSATTSTPTSSTTSPLRQTTSTTPTSRPT